MDNIDSANDTPTAHADKQGARTELLNAAHTLMCERDSLDISLGDIAKRANINAAMVKYYFGNKQGMLVALLDRNLSRSILQIEQLIHMDLSPSQKMRIHIAGVMKLYFRYPYMQRLMIEFIRDCPVEQARELANQFLRPLTDAQATILRQGLDAGEFREVDPKFFYFALLGACDQIFAARYVLRYLYGIAEIDDELERAYAKEITTLVMKGLSVN